MLLQRRSLRRLSFGLLVLVVACGGGPALEPAEPEPIEDPAPPVQGIYDGVLHVNGFPMDVELRIERSGSEISALVTASDGDFEAHGEGRFRGGEFRASLEYSTGCEGTLVLRGRSTSDGTVLRGELEAEDCTGGGAGVFRLQRRRDGTGAAPRLRIGPPGDPR